MNTIKYTPTRQALDLLISKNIINPFIENEGDYENPIITVSPEKLKGIKRYYKQQISLIDNTLERMNVTNFAPPFPYNKNSPFSDKDKTKKLEIYVLSLINIINITNKVNTTPTDSNNLIHYLIIVIIAIAILLLSCN